MSTYKKTAYFLALCSLLGTVAHAQSQSSEELIAEMLRQQTLSHQADLDARQREKELKQATAAIKEEEARIARATTDATLAELEAKLAQREADAALAPPVDLITRDEAMAMIKDEAASLRSAIEAVNAESQRNLQLPSGGFAGEPKASGPVLRWLGVVGRNTAVFEFDGASVVNMRLGQTEDGVTLTSLEADKAVTVHEGRPTTHRLNR